MIAVLAALESELRPLRPLLGRDVALLVRTGIGRAGVERAIKGLQYPRIEALVNIGLCGALTDEIKPGELVLADELLADKLPALEVDPSWLERAERALRGFSCHRGRLLTTQSVLRGPEEKKDKAQSFGALAVDMEGYWVAEAARACQIPFLALKIAFDGATEELPFDESWLDKPLRSLVRSSKRPWRLAELLRWWMRVRTSSAKLARAVEVMISGL